MVDTPGEFVSLVNGLKFRYCVDLSFSCPGNEIGPFFFSALPSMKCHQLSDNPANNFLLIL